MTILKQYLVQFPFKTYVAAKGSEEAIQVAQQVWLESGVDIDNLWSCWSDSEDIVVTESQDKFDGGACYDEETYGYNLTIFDIDLIDGFEIESKRKTVIESKIKKLEEQISILKEEINKER